MSFPVDNGISPSMLRPSGKLMVILHPIMALAGPKGLVIVPNTTTIFSPLVFVPLPTPVNFPPNSGALSFSWSAINALFLSCHVL
jgi:hypothetical protein